MSGKGENNSVCPEEIELLVFTIMGVRMGVDTAQIAGMLKPRDAERQGLVMTALHERLQFRELPVRYSDPHVIEIKSEGAHCGIVIDRPDEITSVKTDSIRPMPPLFALTGSVKALWGAVVRDKEVIFLIDFYKMTGLGGLPLVTE